MNTKNLTKIVILFCLLAAVSFGQVTMTSTTLSAALGGSPTTVTSCFTVASATGIVAPNFSTPNQPTGNQTELVIDHEAIFVNSVNGTYVCGTRGYASTRAASHASGATVWVGPPTAFPNTDPGQGNACVATTLQYLPIVGVSGNTFDCLGVTTAGVIVQTNAPGVPAVGSTVASATSITPTGTYFVVSGTTAIATIVVPAGFRPGMSISINPSGTWATTTAGNIAIIATGVVNRVMIMTWSGSKWIPSYV